MQTVNTRVYAVVNPRAALGKTRRLWPVLCGELTRRLGHFPWDWTQAPTHASTLVRSALRDGCNLIISVGGDGTHNEVVNGFFEESSPLNPEATLAVVSCGSGADFCRSLGVGTTLSSALEAIISERIKELDVGRLESLSFAGSVVERLFINVASLGLSAQVTRLLDSQPQILGGSGRFFMATVRALLANRNAWVTLEVDGKGLPSQIINTVAVGNGRFFGGGMQVAPHARFEDGLLDLVVIGDVGLGDFLRWGVRFYRGRHLNHPRIQYHKARMVRAFSDLPVPVEADGETIGTLPATFTVMPRALRVRVPA